VTPAELPRRPTFRRHWQVSAPIPPPRSRRIAGSSWKRSIARTGSGTKSRAPSTSAASRGRTRCGNSWGSSALDGSPEDAARDRPAQNARHRQGSGGCAKAATRGDPANQQRRAKTTDGVDRLAPRIDHTAQHRHRPAAQERRLRLEPHSPVRPGVRDQPSAALTTRCRAGGSPRLKTRKSRRESRLATSQARRPRRNCAPPAGTRTTAPESPRLRTANLHVRRHRGGREQMRHSETGRLCACLRKNEGVGPHNPRSSGFGPAAGLPTKSPA
jgi:hypothetical protein